MIYNMLGKAAVRFAIVYLRGRYRRQIRIGAGLAAALVAVALYLASRNVPEG
jgi:hypothetical protein